MKTLIAPVIGVLAMAGACYLLIDNRAALSGAGDVLFIKHVPWVVLAVFLIGCVAGAVDCAARRRSATSTSDASCAKREVGGSH